MNQTMNDACKKDLPNLYEWCEKFAQRTGIRISAGNPPVGLILEEVMGTIATIHQQVNAIHQQVLAIEKQILESLEEKTPQAKEKVKK